jgi:hypothetical protein
MEEYTVCGPRNSATLRACFHHLSRPRMTVPHNGHEKDFEPFDCICLDNISTSAYLLVSKYRKMLPLIALLFNCLNRRKEKPFESTVTTTWGWNNIAASTVSSIFLCRTIVVKSIAMFIDEQKDKH